jgi:hypothetical protein
MVAHQDRLDLGGLDVLAAGHDHVLDAILVPASFSSKFGEEATRFGSVVRSPHAV